MRHYGPVYDYDDPERVDFIVANAVSLVKERDGLIERQRAEIQKLSKANRSLREHVRRCNRERAAYAAMLEQDILATIGPPPGEPERPEGFELPAVEWAR